MSLTDAVSDFEPVASPLLTAEEFGKLLKISERSIWRLNSAGEIPKPVRIGGSVRWRKEEVDDWIKAGCPSQGSRNNDRRRN